jgi:thymidine phosphorylase
MNEPLATAAGNALEVRNAVDFLTGNHQDPRLLEVTLALCTAALDFAGIEGDNRIAVEEALASGQALERFSRMVVALGGPADFVERMDHHLAPAPIVREIMAPGSGSVSEIDTRAVGMAVVALGGGRRLPTDKIDHAVGFDRLLGIGARVDGKTPLAVLHARDDASADDATARLIAAYKFGDKAPTHPLIHDRIDPPKAA